jgi:hypothetical protein
MTCKRIRSTAYDCRASWRYGRARISTRVSVVRRGRHVTSRVTRYRIMRR